MSNGTDGTGNDELWSVRLPNGQTQKGTLDQLDEAFQAGLITSDSLVCAPGETTWAKLGDLAGLDEPAPPAPVARQVMSATPPPVSYAPPPISYAPPPMSTPHSLRPVMMDLDDVAAYAAPEPRSKKPMLFGTLAVLGVLGGIAGLVMMILGGKADAEAAAAALAAQQKPTAPAAAPAPLPPKPPAPAATDDDSAKAKPLLSDKQKKALLDADEARARLSKAKQDALAAARGPTTHKTGIKDSTGFSSPKKSSKPCTCKHGDPLCSCM
jgi:hypothetical protein